MALGFVSGAVVPSRSASRVAARRSATTMSVAKDVKKMAAMVPAVMPMAAMAAEGTGTSLGVEEPLLLVPLFLIPLVFFVLFVQFGRSQDNSDFFGTFDDRRF